MKTNTTKNLIAALAVFFATGLINAQVTHDVATSGSSFSPANITIDLGDTVRWTNTGGTHNVNGTTATFPSNPESFGNALGTGWVFSHKFTTVGSYSYRCDQHFGGGMVGTINVVDPSASVETIAAQSKGNMNIYPIPASSELTIELSNSLVNESAELELRVFDLNGKEVLHQIKISGTTVKLSTLGLENGLYIINLMDGSTKLESQTISIQK